MKNKTVLIMTLLIICSLMLACTFTSGETVKSKSDEDTTEKVEKKKNSKKKKSKQKNKEETDEDFDADTDSDEDEDFEVSETSDAPDAKRNALSNSVRPEGESKPVSSALGKTSKPQNTSEWLYVYNARKGYGFYVPGGSTGEWGRVQNVDTFAGATPDGVGIFVFAWKDRRMSKEVLMEKSIEMLAGMGEKVTAGNIQGASELYAIAEANSIDQNGVKSKLKILVGTDITDNYVMFVGTDADKYAAKQNTIDAIWGTFEMWSGGAGGR